MAEAKRPKLLEGDTRAASLEKAKAAGESGGRHGDGEERKRREDNGNA